MGIYGDRALSRLPALVCAGLAALAAPSNAQNIDLMKGTGSMFRAASGEASFRFVVPENAYRGLISDPAELKQQHEWLIGAWLGQTGNCARGYRIDGREVVTGMVVYTGRCR